MQPLPCSHDCWLWRKPVAMSWGRQAVIQKPIWWVTEETSCQWPARNWSFLPVVVRVSHLGKIPPERPSLQKTAVLAEILSKRRSYNDPAKSLSSSWATDLFNNHCCFKLLTYQIYWLSYSLHTFMTKKCYIHIVSDIICACFFFLDHYW